MSTFGIGSNSGPVVPQGVIPRAHMTLLHVIILLCVALRPMLSVGGCGCRADGVLPGADLGRQQAGGSYGV